MDDKGVLKKGSCQEKRGILYVASIVVSVVGLAAIILLVKLKGFYSGDVCLSEKCAQASVFFIDILNPSVDPCQNFYNFSCGGYEGNSTLASAQQLVNKIFRSYITSPTSSKDSRSVKLQKKYYRACMDLNSIEEDDNRSLKKIFRELGGWPLLERHWNEDKFDIGRIVEKCIEKGLYYDWFLYIENEPSFNQSNENLHIKPPDNINKITEELKDSYVLLLANVVNSLGSREVFDPVSDVIQKIVKFEHELYQIVEGSKKYPQEEICTMDNLKREFSFMPWTQLMKNVVWANGTKIICSVREFLSKFGKLLNKTPKRVQANYIFWKITESLQAFLSEPVRGEFQNFDVLRGNAISKDRTEYCYGVTSAVFAYVSEGEYVRKHAKEREEVKKIVRNIEQVLKLHIENSTWMNNTHKNYAFSKLKNMRFVIGGPIEMFDEVEFDKLLGLDEIDILHLRNTLDIITAVDRSRDAYNLDLKRRKVSFETIKFYHGVTSLQTIKYLPDQNLMYLPAAAFNAPIYSEKRPQYLNYGALGTIIGHELVHGFGLMDSEMYQFGKKTINWSNATFEDFFDTAECLLNHCNDVGDGKNYNISCKKTFEENFADYTGINLSYEAYSRLNNEAEKRLPGLSYRAHQLFWISYASTMCFNNDVNTTENFTHMLPYQRIMGSFRNSEYFSKDFNCPAGSNMNPETKCTIL